MNKKIYIAGCGGMLGEAFYRQFSQKYELKCTDIDVNETWLSYLDFRDFDSYNRDVESFKPDFLFHLGAFTDLEYCESHESETYVTNTLSVENAVIIANNLDIPLLYISTAGIFDGRKDVYDDWDMPNPLGVYARSKYMGERYVVENARRYLICRAGWMMGGGHKDKKFVKKIMTQINSGVTELNVVNDKDGTPTYTHDFAKNTLMLLESGIWGLYNMVCHGMTSRYEVAAEVIRILKLENQVKLNSVGSDYFSTDYYAPRPKSERLINRKLMLRGIDYMQDWKSALSEYLNDYSF